MDVGSANFKTLKQALFSRLDAQETGTLFVATDDNHAAQIVLFKGQLLGLAYAGMSNADALVALQSLPGLKFSFTPELVYPLADTLLPEQAQMLMRGIGYQPKQLEPEEEAPVEVAEPEVLEEAPRSNTLRVYRGRVISGSL